MRNPLAYFVSVAIALCLVLGSLSGGAGYFVLPFLGFVFMPVADRWAGQSRWPSENALRTISPARERAYDAALVTAFTATLGVLAWGLWVASAWTLEAWEMAGLAISVGMFTGYVGIVVAHELIHRPSVAHRAMGWVLMSAALYPHFCVEHILGHHPRFATPDDHATARRGEALYVFIPRSIIRGLFSGLRFRPVSVLAAYAVLIGILFAIHRWLGVHALMLMLIQALVAVILLEGINYLEHYGLLRERRPNGQYEPPGPGHSWDTSFYLTNTNIFNLGRHSDHHSHSRRPYYRLRHNDEAPQLPFGYATMFLIALVPPLWFRIMDRRLDEWHARKQARNLTGTSQRTIATSA